MDALITDLLAFSAVGRAEAPPAEVDLNRVAAAVRDTLGEVIAEARAEVVLDPLPKVKGNETQLGQLLQNLISNALKFRGKDPVKVRLWSEPREGEWVIGVTDNGIGIEPEYRERIFVIFQRLHSRKEYPGTGIGLAICKKIVERHEGRIWVESDPGKGTTFFFTLPERRT